MESPKKAMSTLRRFYGFYSQKAVDNGRGSVIYLTPEGKEVEVTAVYEDKDGTDYLWPDKVCVGQVAKYLRPNKEGRYVLRSFNNEV